MTSYINVHAGRRLLIFAWHFILQLPGYPDIDCSRLICANGAFGTCESCPNVSDVDALTCSRYVNDAIEYN